MLFEKVSFKENCLQHLDCKYLFCLLILSPLFVNFTQRSTVKLDSPERAGIAVFYAQLLLWGVVQEFFLSEETEEKFV